MRSVPPRQCNPLYSKPKPAAKVRCAPCRYYRQGSGTLQQVHCLPATEAGVGEVTRRESGLPSGLSARPDDTKGVSDATLDADAGGFAGESQEWFRCGEGSARSRALYAPSRRPRRAPPETDNLPKSLLALASMACQLPTRGKGRRSGLPIMPQFALRARARSFCRLTDRNPAPLID